MADAHGVEAMKGVYKKNIHFFVDIVVMLVYIISDNN